MTETAPDRLVIELSSLGLIGERVPLPLHQNHCEPLVAAQVVVRLNSPEVVPGS